MSEGGTEKDHNLTRRDFNKLVKTVVTGAAINWVLPNLSIEVGETDFGQDSALKGLANIHKSRLKRIAKENNVTLEANQEYSRPIWQIRGAVDGYEAETGNKAFYNFHPERINLSQAKEVIDSVDIARDMRKYGLVELRDIWARYKAGEIKRVDFQVANKVAKYSPSTGYGFYLNAIKLGDLDPLITAQSGISDRLKREMGIEIKFRYDGQNIIPSELSQSERDKATGFVKNTLAFWKNNFFSDSPTTFMSMLKTSLKINNGDVGASVDETGLVLGYMARNDLNTGAYIAHDPQGIVECVSRFKNFKDTFSIFGKNFQTLERQNSTSLDDDIKDFSKISGIGTPYHGIQTIGNIRRLPTLLIKPSIIWLGLMNGGLLGNSGDLAEHGSGKMYFDAQNAQDLDEAEKYFKTLAQ